MGDGLADGIPPLPSAKARRHWQAVLTQEYEAFGKRVDRGDDTVLDPYGAESHEEFFAGQIGAGVEAHQAHAAGGCGAPLR